MYFWAGGNLLSLLLLLLLLESNQGLVLCNHLSNVEEDVRDNTVHWRLDDMLFGGKDYDGMISKRLAKFLAYFSFLTYNKLMRKKDSYLHLHGLENDESLSLDDLVTGLTHDLRDLAGHGGAQAAGLLLLSDSQELGLGNVQSDLALLSKDVDLIALLDNAGLVHAVLNLSNNAALTSQLGHHLAEDSGLVGGLDTDVVGSVLVELDTDLDILVLELEGELLFADLVEAEARVEGEGRGAILSGNGSLLGGLEISQDHRQRSLGNGGGVQRRSGLEHIGLVLLDESSLNLPGNEGGVGSEGLQELNVGVQSNNLVLAQSLAEDTESSGSVFTVDNQLGDHGVVVDRDLISLNESSLQTNGIRGLGGLDVEKGTDIGQEVVVGVFGIDTGLKGPSVLLQLVLELGQSVSCSDLELPLDQVGVSDHLGDGMLDLKTGVHLHKVEFLVSVVHDEFDSSCSNVIDSLGSGDGLLSQLASEFLRKTGLLLLDIESVG